MVDPLAEDKSEMVLDENDVDVRLPVRVPEEVSPLPVCTLTSLCPL